MLKLLIKNYMTPAPHGIEPHEQLASAKKRMLDLNIHHLPVRSGGKVVGIISMRDLEFIENIEHVDMQKTSVGKVMATEPYTIAESTPLQSVIDEMVRYNYGSAVVINEKRECLGIFTHSDALRVLRDLLQQK